MSAATDLAAALRQPRPPRTIGGVVVETVDAAHVRCDIGDKAVVAYTARSLPVGASVRLLVGNGLCEVLSGGGGRTYSTVLNDISKANGQAITTLAIPAQPQACRVHVVFSGVVGFSATANIEAGFTPSASAGTATWAPTHPVRCSTAAQWYGYGHGGYVDLPAATPCTVTLTAAVTGGANAYVAGILTATVS